MTSDTKGNKWDIIYEDGGFSKFLHISNFYPNLILTGGNTPIFSPYLAISQNGGEAWTLLNNNIYTGSDGVCYDAIIRKDNSEQILVALNGIIRTKDGGGNWEQVFNRAGVRTFTHSAHNAELIYASGQNQSGTLFFAASNDFGDTWQIVEMPDSPPGHTRQRYDIRNRRRKKGALSGNQ